MRVDIPEYDTFVDFPDDTTTDVIQNVLQENFPSNATFDYSEAPEEEIPAQDTSIAVSPIMPSTTSTVPTPTEEILTIDNIASKFKGAIADMYNAKVIYYGNNDESRNKAFAEVSNTLGGKMQIKNIIKDFQNNLGG